MPSKNNNNNHDTIIKQLSVFVNQFKTKLLILTLIKVVPWLCVLLVIGNSFQLPYTLLIISFFCVCLSAVFICVRSTRFQQVNLSALLFHLNRVFPQLQESAQLLIQGDRELSTLQKLQKRQISIQLEQLLLDKKQNLLPAVYTRKLIVTSVSITVFVFVVWLTVFLNPTWLPSSPSLFTTEINHNQLVSSNKHVINATEIQLAKSELVITPPTYTQLNVRQQAELDVITIERSNISWQLSFNHPIEQAFIEFSQGERLLLSTQEDGSYKTERQIDFTRIYRVGIVLDSNEHMLPEIHTISITKDSKPKIKIITPIKTITEIATNDNAIISTHVEISDDFAVSHVEILASIAKGSGESVKFRDQIFQFDNKDNIDGIEHYYKNWRLSALNMEPGDELYFTVNAWDNRQPNVQLTRSTTKIIRWLDDDQQSVLSDGMLIDFIPQYFKSQRQIIIETIALINDQVELKKGEFSEKSELLGNAQRDLKEKYGQYLGDEVEDGGGSHAISHEASENISHIMESDSDSNAQAEDEHQHDESQSHASDGFEMKGFGSDKSGASEVINKFGHNHEDADIGIMARQDPKALMKLAIANMWQAELHLMLSAPRKALPYEEEALKYLKMAKKAERIYVKRLGFEPPPVSEQRRYTGDLNDVLSYQNEEVIDVSGTERQQLSDLYYWLNSELNKPFNVQIPLVTSLTSTQRQLTLNVKQQFETLLDSRPALIKYVAILERILLSNSIELAECQHCLAELTAKVWQMLPEPTAKAFSLIKPYSNKDALIKAYANYLSERP